MERENDLWIDKNIWDIALEAVNKNAFDMNAYEHLGENSQDIQKMHEMDNSNALDIIPMVQDVNLDLTLMDLEHHRDFSVFQSTDIWIADIGRFNDGTAHKKGITNLRRNKSSSGTMMT